MDKKTAVKARTPLFRASYVHVWEPRQNSDPKKPAKYQMCLLFPKASTNFDDLKAAAKLAGVSYFGEQRFEALMADRAGSGFKWPLRDGDTKYATNPEKYANYQGMFFINVNSKDRPGVVEIVGNKPVPILDQSQFYSGCWAVATVAFRGYEQDGGIGVGCYVNNICKMKDDVRLSGNADAESDFADFAAQQTAPTSADPLLG